MVRRSAIDVTKLTSDQKRTNEARDAALSRTLIHAKRELKSANAPMLQKKHGEENDE